MALHKNDILTFYLVELFLEPFSLYSSQVFSSKVCSVHAFSLGNSKAAAHAAVDWYTVKFQYNERA